MYSNHDYSCLHSVGSVDIMISELESMWKEEVAWSFPVGIHKNRVSRSSYRFFGLGNFEYEEGIFNHLTVMKYSVEWCKTMAYIFMTG